MLIKCNKENVEFFNRIPNIQNYTEILTLIKMDYYELVEHLLNKYGKAKEDFIIQSKKTGNYRKSIKITRTNEGLQIHHIDEYIIPALSLIIKGHIVPQELPCHKAERLVYANLLEHLLLHIKIYQESKYNDIEFAVGFGGVYLLTENSINNYYKNKPDTSWHKNMYNAISNKYNDYILLLAYWLYISEPNRYNLFYKRTRFADICQRMAVCYDGTINEDVYNSLVALLKEMRLWRKIRQKNREANDEIDKFFKTMLNK